MALVIDPTAQVIEGTPVYPQQPPGSVIVAWNNAIDLTTIPRDELVGTNQMVFITAKKMGQSEIADLVATQEQAMRQNGETIVSYIAYEESLIDVQVPTQICIGDGCVPIPTNLLCIPFTDRCFGGGSTLITAYRYTLWYLSRGVIPAAFGMMARPFVPVLGAGAILAYGLITVAIIITLVAVIQLLRGQLTWGQLSDSFEKFAPGNQIAKAEAPIAWAIIGFGFVAVAAGIFIPMLAAHAQVAIPIGPARVEAGVGRGGGGGRR